MAREEVSSIGEGEWEGWGEMNMKGDRLVARALGEWEGVEMRRKGVRLIERGKEAKGICKILNGKGGLGEWEGG